MKFTEIQTLLNNNNIKYTISYNVSKIEFYSQKGFNQKHIKKDEYVNLIIIDNPNHEKNIELIFDSNTENPNFVDLEFGEYSFELFDRSEDDISVSLLDEIINIIHGNVYIIFARNAKNNKWFFDACFYDSPIDEENDMEEFKKLLEKIHAPKHWLSKITKRVDKYEIYNWEKYNCIIK